MKDIYSVKLSTKAKKSLKKIPLPISLKLQGWIDAVGHIGLTKVRKIPAIRLNISYRAIYTINKTGEIEFVQIQKINKHDY